MSGLGVALLGIPAHPAVNAAVAIRVIHVDDDAALGGNGIAPSPYNNLMDALADARITSAAVVINVAPGDYPIESSLVIDRSLDLRGSSVLIEDSDGWPTGAVEPASETRIVGTGSLGTQPLVAVGRSEGIVIDDVRIRGFVFEGTPDGIGVYLTRVQDFRIHDKQPAGAFACSSFDATSARQATHKPRHLNLNSMQLRNSAHNSSALPSRPRVPWLYLDARRTGDVSKPGTAVQMLV